MRVPVHCQRGLSLIEVLIAVVVIAFGLLAVAGTLGWVSKTNAKIRYQQMALSLIESELAQLEANPQLPPRRITITRNVGRPFSGLPEGSTLTIESEPYPTPTERRLRRVRIKVRWGTAGDPLGGQLVRERLISLR